MKAALLKRINRGKQGRKLAATAMTTDKPSKKPYEYPHRLEDGHCRLIIIENEGTIYEYAPGPYTMYDSKDAIVCSMIDHKLSDESVYDALSYTWSNPLDVFEDKQELERSTEVYKQQLPVICDGQVLLVGASLHDALLAQRRSKRLKRHDAWKKQTGNALSASIWIDAICINQQDIEERNAQVAMMDQIYRRATNVFVWLGPEDAFVHPAIDLISILSGLSLEQAVAARTWGSLEEIDYNELGMKPISKPQWCALYALLARTWFRRAWIVQEIALAASPIFISGNNMLSWSILAKACLFLEFSKWHRGMLSAAQELLHEPDTSSGSHKQARSKLRLYQISEMQGDENIKPSALPSLLHQVFNLRYKLGLDGVDSHLAAAIDINLLTLLSNFRYTECFNPRDKVYAMCGIWKEYLRSSPSEGSINPDWLVSVNYNDSPEQVYLSAAWAMLSHSRSLRLLSYVLHTSDQAELPSWVPDWAARPQAYVMESARADDVKPWKAAFNLPLILPNPNLKTSHLQLRGRKIDTVTTVALYAEQDIFTLADLYHSLPKVTILDPAMKFSEFAKQSSDLGSSQSISSLRIPSAEESISFQTRFEVLWRTVLNDLWDQGGFEHPSPPQAGLAFVRVLATTALYALLTSEDEASRSAAAARNDMLNKFSRDEAECINLLFELAAAQQDQDGQPELSASQFWRAMPPSVQDAVNIMHDPDKKHMMNTWREWESHIFQNDGRKLFSTRCGLAGNGPRSTETGDEVWILAGCDEPCVLRKRSGEDQSYRFVGVVYVHGIMHGECMKSVSAEELEAISLV